MSTPLVRLARAMRIAADRLDPRGAPRATGLTFTIENREGIRARTDGRGCRLWYLGAAEYDRAHDEADNPTCRIDWAAMRLHDRTRKGTPGAPLRMPPPGF